MIGSAYGLCGGPRSVPTYGQLKSESQGATHTSFIETHEPRHMAIQCFIKGGILKTLLERSILGKTRMFGWTVQKCAVFTDQFIPNQKNVGWTKAISN